MSWYTKKIAGLIFSTPPTATFEEALNYFLLAETSKSYSDWSKVVFIFHLWGIPHAEGRRVSYNLSLLWLRWTDTEAVSSCLPQVPDRGRPTQAICSHMTRLNQPLPLLSYTLPRLPTTLQTELINGVFTLLQLILTSTVWIIWCSQKPILNKTTRQRRVYTW